ncbi:unnamed protein product [Rhodiola kirilowii]
MKTLCWNCRGLGGSRTVRSLMEAIREHKPQIVCLIETKRDGRGKDRLKLKLGFPYCFAVSSRGRSGGLAVLWGVDVDLTVRNFSDYHIDTEVRAQTVSQLTLFYGDPPLSRRRLSWELLRRLKQPGVRPWIVLGDFNEVLSDEEVWGMRPRQSWQMNNFREALADCGLTDLGFKGFPYTFTNHREGNREMRARLDRAVANDEWRRLHPRAEVTHIHLYASDHQAIVVDTIGGCVVRRKKLFWFEAMWCDHPGFGDLMEDFWQKRIESQTTWMAKLKSCKNTLKIWNTQTFGNVQRRIKELKEKIRNN